MCRNIKKLRYPDRLPTEQELYEAALQYVRKISGYRQPSKINEKAFYSAVNNVTRAGKKLFEQLNQGKNS